MKTLLLALGLLVIASASPLSLAAGEVRTWTSSDGRTIEASLQSAASDAVTIRRADGRTFTIPLEKLSETDRAYVRSLENEEARRNGFNEGPYADAVTGEWVKFPKAKHGLIFQLYIGEKLRRKKDELFPLFIYLHGAGGSGED